MTFGQRLQEEADRWGSVRKLSEELKGREVRGGWRSMIQRYMKGTSPPLEFVEAAADVLGVRPDWLAWGHGPRTEAELEAQQAVERQWRLVDEGIQARVPEVLDRGLISEALRVRVREVAGLYLVMDRARASAFGLPRPTVRSTVEKILDLALEPVVYWLREGDRRRVGSVSLKWQTDAFRAGLEFVAATLPYSSTIDLSTETEAVS